MLCSVCEKEMIVIDMNSDYWAYLCDTIGCSKFAQPGIYKAKNPDKAAKQHFYRWTISGEQYKDEKRERYQLLRNIGIEPKAASAISNGKKRTEEVLTKGVTSERLGKAK
jgi:hypothetical protein